MDQPWGNSRFGSSYCSSSRQRDAGGEETHVSLRKNQVLKPAYIDYISPAPLGVGESQLAHRLRCGNNAARQLAPRPAMILRFLGLRNFEIFFFEQRGLLVQ